MSSVYARAFQVRYCECDAYGHLDKSHYLRYMQEATFDASASAGYSVERFATSGHYWLVHEVDVEYIVPLFYGESIELTTWVADFRRVRSLRMYELKRVETHELVAKGSIDWVYINRATRRPALIPPEIVSAYAPDGCPQAGLRPSFPVISLPADKVFTMRRRVEWRDIDGEQVVSNATYLNYVDDCHWQMMKAHGQSQTRFQSEALVLVPQRVQIEYNSPVFLDNELEVKAWLVDANQANLHYHYIIQRLPDGFTVAQASIFWAWVHRTTKQPIDLQFQSTPHLDEREL